MTTTPVNVAGLDGGSKAVTLRADQNPDNSLAMRVSLEIGGAAVGAGNAVPVGDAALNAAAGTPADAAWPGTGSASIIAALKALWTALTGTLTATLTGALPAGTNAIGAVSASPFALTNSASGTVTTAAEVIVPYSASRKWLMVSNRTTGIEIHDIGSSNVLVGSGIPVAPGGGFLFNGAGAAGPIYGITTVANSPFSYVEG